MENETEAVEEVVETEPEALSEPPAPEEPASGSPWANDLQELFEDEGVRGNVDAFLREKVQPYITKMEQDSAADRRAKYLWDELSTRPYETFEQIAREIYGDEVAKKMVAAMDSDDEPGSTPELDNEPVNESVFDLDDLPKEVQALVREHEENAQRAEFEAELEKVRAYMDDKNIPFDDDVFYPFVSAAQGDINEAVDGYIAWTETAKSTFGFKAPSADGIPDEIQTPPPAISSTSRQAEAPDPAPKYDSLDDAVSSWLREENAPPPVVGNQ